MNYAKTAVALLLSVPLTSTGLDLLERVAASREAVQTFSAELRSELQKALEAGGPVNGLTVCKVKAVDLAAAASERSGMSVARTSLKVRNPANAPDAWERKVLEGFEARKAAGQEPDTIEFFGVVEQDGRKLFRYMKAIPTGPTCLLCHGDAIPEDVRAKLDELYPDDAARGFREGDLRGAFTLSQPL